MLVLDATVLIAGSLSEAGWSVLRGEQSFTPPWGLAEAVSVLHESMWRGERSPEEARQAAERVMSAPIIVRRSDPLAAWDVANELGWAKTYDAEYVALARGLGCRLVTLDGRLRRGASRLVEIIDPSELQR